MIKNIRMVDAKYLKTFYWVTECKSFSDAADTLYLTQPAVSQHIKKIEEEIGAKLLERGRDVKLTREGRVLYKYTKKSIKLYDGLFEELRQLNDKKKYKIAISTKYCSVMANDAINSLSSILNDCLYISYFDEESSLDISDFDIVLGVSNAPDKSGLIVKMNNPLYNIFYSDKDLSVPKRVIYCKDLSRREVKELLKSEGFDTGQVINWISSDSSAFMLQQLCFEETLIVGPVWSITNDECEKIVTNQCANCYGWCGEQLARLLSSSGYRHSLSDLLTRVAVRCESEIEYVSIE